MGRNARQNAPSRDLAKVGQETGIFCHSQFEMKEIKRNYMSDLVTLSQAEVRYMFWG